METLTELDRFLRSHLQSILDNDTEAYHRSTFPELTLYEWWVTPHRIEGLPFHDFMMESNKSQGTVFGSDADPGAGEMENRFDLANLKIQEFGDAAIASYTLLISTKTAAGVQVASHNESRVMVKIEGAWKVVHVHKSPAYSAPHSP